MHPAPIQVLNSIEYFNGIAIGATKVQQEEIVQQILGLVMLVGGGVIAYFWMGNLFSDFASISLIFLGVGFAGGNDL